MIDVSIVISTFGNKRWEYLANTRAIPSANRLGVPVIYNHGPSLYEARNLGLNSVKTEFVCHLDADDELDSRFLHEIAAAEGDLRAPSVQYKRSGGRAAARMPKVAGHTHDCVADCLDTGNWLVVGTVAPTELLLRVGGWRDYAWSEDWDLWQRCWIAGATVVPVPKAIYIAHTNPRGRNNSRTHADKVRIHHEIRKENLPHLYR
jgi:glycosyltransferase involved in cell wall biosynthesis